MKFEDILEDVGSFGLYQRILCFTIIPLTTGACGLVYYAQIFLLTAPQHLCRANNPILEINQTFRETLEFLSHFHNGTDGLSSENPFSCKMVNISDSVFKIDGVQSQDESNVLCENGWVYNTDTMFPTLTSQNDWVCEDAWKPYLIISCFWIGNTVGAWIFGALSDILGRKPVIALVSVIYGVTGIVSVFVTEFYGHLVLRTLMGTAHITISHLPFIYVIEFCGVRSRVIPVFVVMISYTMASIFAPILAWSIWQWQILAVSCSAPALLVIIFYKWMPESPSWLMTKGKLDEAVQVLHTMSKINGKSQSKEQIFQAIRVLDEDAAAKKDDRSFCSFCGFSKLRKNILLVLFIWVIACLCYYGHCQNTANLGNNIFTSYFFGALVEVPAWGTPFLMHKLGRKKPLVTTFLISGIAVGIYAMLPQDAGSVLFAFALIGRMFITSAYYITLQYGPEIYPTEIRGRGVALSETLGGVAIFVSPLIVYTGEFYKTLPLMIFGILSILGGAVTLFLPETGGRALPQTLEEGEEFADHEKRLSNLRSSKRTDKGEVVHHS